jgi:hypothetical protein
MSVPPGFANPIPRTFPFSDADVVAGTTTNCQILAYYRQVYMPAAGSPLVDAGDPMEGAGNDIGAIGAGADNALDKFGRNFCDPLNIGAPALDGQAYQCKAVPVVQSGGGGTVVPPGLPSGITCVCELGAGRSAPAGWALLAAGATLALSRRRSRRRSRPRSRPTERGTRS